MKGIGYFLPALTILIIIVLICCGNPAAIVLAMMIGGMSAFAMFLTYDFSPMISSIGKVDKKSVNDHLEIFKPEKVLCPDCKKELEGNFSQCVSCGWLEKDDRSFWEENGHGQKNNFKGGAGYQNSKNHQI